MATLQIGESLELDDAERMSIDLLVPNGLTKGVIKRVVADNADDEWRIRRGKCVGWPFHKFGEVINKCGFELKFRRGGLLRPGRRAMEEGRQQKEQMANGKWQNGRLGRRVRPMAAPRAKRVNRRVQNELS